MARPERERDDGPSTIRLFVEAPLAAGAAVVLASGQAHYLRNVMRRKPGDRVRLFNGRDGEWEGAIETLAPSRAGIRLGAQLAPQPPAPDLRLLFAPLKAERTRFAVEKATELGVGAIHPVLTRYGQIRRVNVERLRAHAIEAAEQCGRLEVPSVAPPALSPMRSPAGRRSAGYWSAIPRPNARSPSRWPTPRQASWWGRKAASRRPSGACSPGIRRPSPPAWAPASCARRPPWPRLWLAGRRLPATGAEAARRRTQPCHVRPNGSTGWTAAPE